MLNVSNGPSAREALTRRAPVKQSSTSSGSGPGTTGESQAWTFRSSSDESIVPHLGAISGRYLQAFGKAEIQAIRTVWIPYRQRQIHRAFNGRRDGIPSKDLNRIYDDLIDFTR